MASSPTQRSLANLKARGYEVAVVERWNAFAQVRQDLFGWMDLLAYNDGVTIGVQTTTRDNMNARIEKILASERAASWVSPQRRLFVHGWAKRKERGKARVHYELVEVSLSANDFNKEGLNVEPTNPE